MQTTKPTEGEIRGRCQGPKWHLHLQKNTDVLLPKPLGSPSMRFIDSHLRHAAPFQNLWECMLIAYRPTTKKENEEYSSTPSKCAIPNTKKSHVPKHHILLSGSVFWTFWESPHPPRSIWPFCCLLHKDQYAS